jgi:hypothetical protein
MGTLIAWLGRILLGGAVSLFSGWRTWLGAFLIKTFLVVVLYNLIAKVLQELIEWVVDKLGGVTVPDAVVSNFNVGSFTTLGAWFVTIMRLPECCAFMLSVIFLKWTLVKIPFIKWS